MQIARLRILCVAVPALALLLLPPLVEWGRAFAQAPALEEASWGDEEGWGEEDDEIGFEEVEDSSEVQLEAPSPWSFKGSARSDWAAWVERFDSNPFAKGRQSLDLEGHYKTELDCSGCVLRAKISGHLEYDLAYQYQREDYDQPTLDAYEWLAQARENYLWLSNGTWEIRSGRQIVAWGEGEMLSPLDVVCPRDMREPGLSDLDDIRLAVFSSRLAYNRGSHRLELMLVHEKNFGLVGAPLGPFSPLRSVFDSGAQEIYPGATFQDILIDRVVRFEHRTNREVSSPLFFDQQAFTRWSYRGAGFDTSLYGASVLLQQGIFEPPALSELATADSLALGIQHPRYQLLGNSGALPFGSWLLKWEALYAFDKPFMSGQASYPPVINQVRADSIEGMLGLAYSGIQDLTITMEAQKILLVDDLVDPLSEYEAPTISANLRYTTLRERLQLSLVGLAMGLKAEMGWLGGATASYEISDGWKVKLSANTFQPTDEFGPFYGLENHDRISLQLRWDFLL